jgi:acetyltransferase-like isoleucine patch superfamily enzyme
MRKIIKTIVRLLFVVLTIPFVLLFKVQSLITNKDQAMTSWSQFMSLCPGLTGVYLRAAFYSLTLKNTSPDIVIGFATLFSQHDTQIGFGTYIGPQCNIGKCTIAENCLLGSGVHIMSGKGQHNFTDPDKPLREQGGVFSRVSIGEDSWLGNGALIMANVGKKCVVGAGSVVVSDIPDYAIVGGNPAKVLGSRKPTDN